MASPTPKSRVSFDIYGACLELYAEDIAGIPGFDIVVSSDDDQLSHGGGVSYRLALMGGGAYISELREAARPLGGDNSGRAIGSVVMTGAGDLPFRQVFHVVTIAGSNRLDDRALTQSVLECLNLAGRKGFTSILLPAIGTGTAKYSAKDAAQIIIRSVVSYLSSGSMPLKKIGISVINEEVLAEFDREFTGLRFREIQNSNDQVRRELAIMFLDLVGSTKMFEDLGDEAALRMIDEYESCVLPPIKDSGGDLVKKMGDGIFASFEGPANASRAATNALRALAKSPPNTHESLLRIRVGIHYGTVTSRSGDLFGDVVNTASRIQSLASPNKIYISAEAKGLLSPQWMVRDLGMLAVKGKAAPIRVFEVIDDDLHHQ